jgi:hypothetical protein
MNQPIMAIFGQVSNSQVNAGWTLRCWAGGTTLIITTFGIITLSIIGLYLTLGRKNSV